MKKFFIGVFLCSLLICTAIFADENTYTDEPEKIGSKRIPPETLFNRGEVYFSGYCSPVAKFTEFDGTYGVLAGGKGGLIINDKLVIGGGGYGFTRTLKRPIGSEMNELGIGYGGFLMEYYFFPKRLVHFSIGVLAGGGAFEYWPEGEYDFYDDDDDERNFPNDKFYVVEPEITIFLNITRFCRIGVGSSYRYIKGIDTPGISEKGFSRFSGSGMIAFGWF
jgi:hypothetical protein